MKKAILMLQKFDEANKLKSLCKDLEISYSLVLSLLNEEKKPNFKTMEKFCIIFPPQFWFENVTDEFLEKVNAFFYNT